MADRSPVPVHGQGAGEVTRAPADGNGIADGNRLRGSCSRGIVGVTPPGGRMRRRREPLDRRDRGRGRVPADRRPGARRHLAVETYGALKDGLSLTPTVLKAVVFAPDVEGSEPARRRGAANLVGRVRADGAIDAGPFGLAFPVYSAAEAAIVLTRVEVAGAAPARAAWLAASAPGSYRRTRLVPVRSGLRRLGRRDRTLASGADSGRARRCRHFLDPVRAGGLADRRAPRPTTPRSARRSGS